MTGSPAARSVAFTAAIAGLAGLLFGYDTGVIAGALLFITPDFGLGSFEAGLVVAAVPIGAVFGAMAAARISDSRGRRLTILWAAAVFAIGAIGSAAAAGTGELVGFRIIVGVAIGLASAVAPVYISEVAPPEIRGRLVTFFQLAVTIGIVLAYLVGVAFTASDGWRWMLGIGAFPAAILALGMWRMPQSPRWLVMSGDEPAARQTLEKIREPGAEAIDREMDEIRVSLEGEKGRWSDLRAPVVRAALVVGIGLAILQQVSGINTVIYYAPTIIQFTGVNESTASILAALGVGFVNVGMTLVAIRLLDRTGRRPLLLAGSATMGLALAMLGVAFLSGADSGLDTAIAVGSLALYVGAFAVSLGPIFWLLNAEIYDLKVRSKAAAVGTMANWIFNFIVSLTFLVLIDDLGRSGTFFLYAGICALTFVFCWRLVPETKGKHLEEIKEIFRGRVAS